MKSVDWKLIRNVGSLCLPTAVVALLGIHFLIERVPDIIRNERRRVQAEYREKALELKAHPEAGFQIVRGKSGNWAKDRKMAPGYWGTVPEGSSLQRIDASSSMGSVPKGKTLIWYVDEKDVCLATFADAIEEVDFCFIFWVCGSFVLVLLIGLTWMGVRYFVDYVKGRDDFLAATAHDLTTPLVGMRYTIGQDDQEAKNLNERMIRLVENIKDFLKLGGQRPQPKLETIDLIKCYNEAYSLFREDYRDVFEGRDVVLSVESSLQSLGTDPQPAGSVPVLADETMTVQILWNLLGNDLKYAAPYGTVRARIAMEGTRVVFELIDEGKGMTPSEMRHAFDRYYRAKSVLESGKGGFGIGLCTAREFAEAMGGALTVRANHPQGCIFTFSLPDAIQ